MDEYRGFSGSLRYIKSKLSNRDNTPTEISPPIGGSTIQPTSRSSKENISTSETTSASTKFDLPSSNKTTLNTIPIKKDIESAARKRKSLFSLRIEKDKSQEHSKIVSRNITDLNSFSSVVSNDEQFTATPKIDCIENFPASPFFSTGMELDNHVLIDSFDNNSVKASKDIHVQKVENGDSDKNSRKVANDQPANKKFVNIEDKKESEVYSNIANDVSVTAIYEKQKQTTIEESKNNTVEAVDSETSDSRQGSDSSAEIVTVSKMEISSNGLPSEVKKDHPEFSDSSDLFFSLFVGDIDKKVTELSLKELFKDFKGLSSVKIPLNCHNGESLGYGYVNFATKEQADIAMEALNYTKLLDKEIRIMPSLRDKTQRERIGANIFLSNLPDGITTRLIYDKFKKFGTILSCKYNLEKQYAFIHFESKDVAYQVVKNTNHTLMNGKLIYAGVHILKKDRELFGTSKTRLPSGQNSKVESRIDISKVPTYIPSNSINSTVSVDNLKSSSKTTNDPASSSLSSDIKSNVSEEKGVDSEISTQFSIFVRNLPLNIEDSVIENLVSPYGKVASVLSRKVPKRNGTWALVTLTNQRSVDMAISKLNLVEINGHQLFVTRAIPKEQKNYYTAKLDPTPKYKLKILITGLNINTHKAKFEEWCLKFGTIKSIELYGTYPTSSKKNDFTAYGYVEMMSVSDTDKLMESLKLMGIYCFKVKVEIPKKTFEPSQFKGLSTSSENLSSTHLSYVDPSKMFQLAVFNKAVESDKLIIKRKLASGKSRQPSYIIDETRKNIEEVIGDLATKLLGTDVLPTSKNMKLTKPKISSLTDHIIKFFWSSRAESLWKFLESNVIIDGKYNQHPLLKTQIIQSANYLGIIPKI